MSQTKSFKDIQISTLKEACLRKDREVFAHRQAYEKLNFELMQVQIRLREVEEKLEQARETSIHDFLTGLATRAEIEGQIAHHFHLLERTKRHVEGGAVPNADQEEFSLMYIDLNDFKRVNDTFGHEAGDTILVNFAAFLKQYFNRGSDIIARLGGDEFVVLLAGVTPKSKAERIKEKFLNAANDFEVSVTDNEGNEHIVAVRCSVGVSSTSDGHTNSKELKAAADKEMYAHKAYSKSAA